MNLISNIPDRSIDLVLTDPPYGINYQSQRRKNRSQWLPKIINDKYPFVEFIPLLKRIIKPDGCIMIFSRWDVQQEFIDKMEENKLHVKNVLIWDKVAHGMGDLKRSFASRYESILFHSEDGFKFPGKRPQDIITHNRVPSSKLTHPNEKPVELLEDLIKKCTAEQSTVLDCFMGSGSTGVACIHTNRNFIGIEIDKKYYDLASNRINHELNKMNR